METQEDRRRLIEAVQDGRIPDAMVKKYIETGIIDGTLWPIRVPLTWKGKTDA